MFQANDLPSTTSGSNLQDQAWKSPAQWRAANAVLSFLILRKLDGLGRVRQIVEDVKSELSGIFPILDNLCEMTCPACPAPCCKVADAGFDFRDLIYLHLTGAAVPIGQPRGEGYSTCRYLGPSGCRLPRNLRPWICTWYLCPRQKKDIFNGDSGGFGQLTAILEKVKQQRKQIEAEFIAVLIDEGQ